MGDKNAFHQQIQTCHLCYPCIALQLPVLQPITLYKKTWGVKIYFTNKFEHATYVTRVLHFNHPSCNSTLIKKHVIGSNLSLIAQKKKFKDQIKIYEKLYYYNPNKMWEGEQWCDYSKNTTSFSFIDNFSL